MSVECVAQEREDIAGDFAGFTVLGELDFGAVRDDAPARANSNVGVPPEAFASFDRFEEEALGLGGGEAQKGRNWRFEVGGKRSIKRDERVRACQAKELGASGL
jgi:hypothetical protein